ncbi:MAG: restriction endonuclease subunit S [Bacteroidetes bacterium]|nr:restriction endonuclease subunit S [Bacteroidota bacterium]
MTKNNNTTTCYKSSPLGLIPIDWEVRKFKDIILEGRLGGNYENAEANEGIPVMKMGNIDRGVIKLDKIQYLPEDCIYNEEDVLKEGDLLFNTRNTLDLVGKVAIWKNELPLAVYNSNLMRMKFDEAFVVSNYFMNYAFNSNYALNQLKSIATGTTSVAAIYGRDLDTIKFILPSHQEQIAISKAISHWESCVDIINKLIFQKEQRKNWLMQQLLTGKKRLKGFEREKLVMKNIHSFAKEISIKNKEDKDLVVLSCTKYDGLVPSLEYFGRKIYSDDLTTYKVVPKFHFAYATNHIEEGSIGYQSKMDLALISPMYTVFKTDENIDDVYLYRVLKSQLYIHEYKKRMEGSIDRRGGLRWDEFSKIKVPVPSIKEQNAISNFFLFVDKEIELLQNKLNYLKEQKKGLMQQLLTGKKRLKIK